MRINKDVALSCTVWGLFMAFAFTAIAFQTFQWAVAGQWGRAAAGLFLGFALCGIPLYIIWNILTEKRIGGRFTLKRSKDSSASGSSSKL
jgi:hypothetical protein